MQLIGRQLEIAIEPIDEAVRPRHAKQMVTVGGRGEGESEQQAGNRCQRDAAPFQATAQSRYWPPGNPR